MGRKSVTVYLAWRKGLWYKELELRKAKVLRYSATSASTPDNGVPFEGWKNETSIFHFHIAMVPFRKGGSYEGVINPARHVSMEVWENSQGSSITSIIVIWPTNNATTIGESVWRSSAYIGLYILSGSLPMEKYQKEKTVFIGRVLFEFGEQSVIHDGWEVVDWEAVIRSKTMEEAMIMRSRGKKPHTMSKAISPDVGKR